METAENKQPYRMNLVCTLDSSIWASPEYHLWQALFDLYRKNGGNLSRMNDLLVDFKSCEDWTKRIKNKESVKPVLFCFDTCGLSLWFSSSEGSNWYWSGINWEFSYLIEYNEDKHTISISQIIFE